MSKNTPEEIVKAEEIQSEVSAEETAKEEKKTPLEIAAFYTEKFLNDFDRLNINRPEIICKATDHIKEMEELL